MGRSAGPHTAAHRLPTADRRSQRAPPPPAAREDEGLSRAESFEPGAALVATMVAKVDEEVRGHHPSVHLGQTKDAVHMGGAGGIPLSSMEYPCF
jgi:hypothetical protein